jgi:hypothetical protein
VRFENKNSFFSKFSKNALTSQRCVVVILEILVKLRKIKIYLPKNCPGLGTKVIARLKEEEIQNRYHHQALRYGRFYRDNIVSYATHKSKFFE